MRCRIGTRSHAVLNEIAGERERGADLGGTASSLRHNDARPYGDDRTPIVDSRRAKIERKPLPDRASVLRRCHAERPHERTRHVTLIGKAGAGSGIGERQPSFDETPRERDAPLNQIGVGR